MEERAIPLTQPHATPRGEGEGDREDRAVSPWQEENRKVEVRAIPPTQPPATPRSKVDREGDREDGAVHPPVATDRGGGRGTETIDVRSALGGSLLRGQVGS